MPDRSRPQLRRGHSLPRASYLLPLCLIGACKFALTANQEATNSQAAKAALVVIDPGDGRVQLSWQAAFLNRLADLSMSMSKAKGWAVLSYSGWGDNGQVFLIESGDRHLFYQVPMNYARPSAADAGALYFPEEDTRKQWRVSEAGWQNFAKEMSDEQWKQWMQLIASASDLTSLDRTVFDGSELEFLTAERDDQAVKVVKRVYMNTPDAEAHKAHYELAGSFRKLAEEASGVKP